MESNLNRNLIDADDILNEEMQNILGGGNGDEGPAVVCANGIIAH